MKWYFCKVNAQSKTGMRAWAVCGTFGFAMIFLRRKTTRVLRHILARKQKRLFALLDIPKQRDLFHALKGIVHPAVISSTSCRVYVQCVFWPRMLLDIFLLASRFSKQLPGMRKLRLLSYSSKWLSGVRSLTMFSETMPVHTCDGGQFYFLHSLRIQWCHWDPGLSDSEICFQNHGLWTKKELWRQIGAKSLQIVTLPILWPGPHWFRLEVHEVLSGITGNKT